MKILIALTYYRPHYSGLTIYTERLARALVKRGHQVTVLTSRFNSSLPAHEIKDGVEIYRLNVLLRISKGVIMPSMPFWAIRLVRQADVVNLHVPQLDAAPIAVTARLLGKPVVLTYHCDMRLPKGFIHGLANQVSHLANHISARMANVIVTNTRDYAENSPFLGNYLEKVTIVPTPVELPEVSDEVVRNFCEKYDIRPGQPIIGMATRLATEKGAEYLAQAMPAVLQKFPAARVLYVGEYEHVLGEESYARRVNELIKPLGQAWQFLGILSSDDLVAFFKSCTLTVLPSINSTESFGIVQIESMICGTPVVATDLPGVRQPVRISGMGKIVPARDASQLAEAIMAVLERPDDFGGDRKAITEQFSPETISGNYEHIFKSLIK